jgi:hypothetical protein
MTGRACLNTRERKNMQTIVTHTNPDMDAIASAWILKKYLLPDAEIFFVNTGATDPALLDFATAVVDTGKVYDTARLRFDHHQFPGESANSTCAAMQVYWYLLGLGAPVTHLESLIFLIYQGDTGKPEANESRRLGIHALLSGYKFWFRENGAAPRIPDDMLYEQGARMLDVLESWLRKQRDARAELAEKVVYRSPDNAVWAIRHGGVSTTFAAYEEGAQVIVFEAEPLDLVGGTTYGVGITRAQESTTDVGQLAKAVAASHPEFAEEIGRWFCHPAGFFAGRGTAKAPVFEPVTVDIATLARAIYEEL